MSPCEDFRMHSSREHEALLLFATLVVLLRMMSAYAAAPADFSFLCRSLTLRMGCARRLAHVDELNEERNEAERVARLASGFTHASSMSEQSREA